MARGKPNPMMLGVLGVAVAALVTDRFLTSASASEDAASAATTEPTDAVGADPARADRAQQTLADRFDDFRPVAEDTDFADAFATLETTSELPAPAADEAEPEVGLKLTAVLRRPDGNIAVINGQPLRAGQRFGNCRVFAIDDDGVHVETEVGPITLTLDQPSLGGR